MDIDFILSLGSVNVLTPTGLISDFTYTCEDAAKDCRPQYVFSVPGQVGFRMVLNHVRMCNSLSCRTLKMQIYRGTEDKLGLLRESGKQLGCMSAQDLIYGRKGLCMRRKEFPRIARHLSYCPEEKCAQLRRAVLLTIRDQMHKEQMGV